MRQAVGDQRGRVVGDIAWAVGGEATRMVLAFAIGVICAALLIYAPRAFFLSSTAFGYQTSVQGWLQGVLDYLVALLQGDIGGVARGRSFNRPLFVAARRSLELLLVSAAVAVPLGLAWGGLLATVRRRVPAALLLGLSTVLLALPSFAIIILLAELVTDVYQRTGVRLAYVQGYGLDLHLLLPVSALALRGAAFQARALQVAQESIMRQDWITVARARGLGGWTLWWRHVLPALRLPLLGGTLGMLRVMVSGVIIVDYVSAWGGLGTRIVRAAQFNRPGAGDEGVATGAAVMIVGFFVVVDALARLVQRYADPLDRTGGAHG